jgi:hypothetical protein
MPHRPGAGRGHLEIGEIAADFARRDARLAARAHDAGLSRREFLQVLAAAAVLPSEPPPIPLPSPKTPVQGPKSRVVVITHPEVILKDYRVNPGVIRQMVDRAVVELTGAADEADAWKKIGRADDFVAVKHNSIGRPTLHSHTEINDVVTARLTDAAQVKPDRILVVDRTLPAPYNELSEPFTLPSRNLQTRLRRLYTDQATAIINISILKAHFTDGLSEALKNHLGSVNNPAVDHGWEPDRMPRSLPELNALAPLRAKTRLVIIDALRPLYAGGPVDDPQYRWDYRGLILSTDPVAASAVGMRILEAKREASGEKRKGPAPKEISDAPSPKAQINFTDPESRIMKDGATHSFEQCLNCQAAVDAPAQIIVAAAVTQEANDKQQVVPMIEKMKENLGGDKPKEFSADNGYFSEDNVTSVEKETIEPFIATGRQKHGEKVLAPRGRMPKNATVKERMARKLRTLRGRGAYKKHKEIVEPVFGQIKGARGFWQFLLRGLRNVGAEWDLICLTHNLLKLHRSGWNAQAA